MSVVKIATRTSKLALVQTHMVRELLTKHFNCEVELTKITSQGDKLTGCLAKHGGKGLFCSALEEVLADERVDMAVHSFKDMPPFEGQGLTIAAVLPREDAADILVTTDGLTIEQLAEGAVVGTSSLRRKCALLAMRPDLDVRLCRGNVPTRLERLAAGEFDAIVLAKAGVKRLGIDCKMVDFSFSQMLPASTQGIIAIQARHDSPWAKKLAALNCEKTFALAKVERLVCRGLNGDCTSAIGVHGVWQADKIFLRAIVYDKKGNSIAAHATDEPNVVADIVVKKLLAQGALEYLQS